MIHDAAALDLTEACPEVEPLVQVVPDWFHPRRLALALEARIGPGKLLVTSANVTRDQAARPAARQFLASMLDYMQSESFRPSTELRLEQIEALIKP